MKSELDVCAIVELTIEVDFELPAMISNTHSKNIFHLNYSKIFGKEIKNEINFCICLATRDAQLDSSAQHPMSPSFVPL